MQVKSPRIISGFSSKKNFRPGKNGMTHLKYEWKKKKKKTKKFPTKTSLPREDIIQN